jgi:hypothetical protein
VVLEKFGLLFGRHLLETFPHLLAEFFLLFGRGVIGLPLELCLGPLQLLGDFRVFLEPSFAFYRGHVSQLLQLLTELRVLLQEFFARVAGALATLPRVGAVWRGFDPRRDSHQDKKEGQYGSVVHGRVIFMKHHTAVGVAKA